MKKWILFSIISSIIIILSQSCTINNSTGQDNVYNCGINITPIPLEVLEYGGHFMLNSRALIVVENNEIEKTANYFITK